MWRLLRFLLVVAVLTLPEVINYASCIEQRLFSYDTSQYLTATDDGYRVMSIASGIKIRQRVYTTIYVCANGLITFGVQFCTYVPNMNSGHDMIAPYWSDLDYRGFSSGVAYSQHNHYDSDSLSRKIIQDTRSYISQNANENNFDPTMVILVTWNKAAPYPSSSYLNTSQRATFQLNLATNGRTTYAIYIYQDGNMLWQNYRRPPHVGYSLSGNVLDMVLSHTGDYPHYRFDAVKGNTGRKGQWVWNLGRLNDRIGNRAEKCLRWYKDQPNDDYIKMIRLHSQSVCPCSFSQMQLDSRYRSWYRYQNVDCFRQRGIWYFHDTKISFFTVCCYHPQKGYLYGEFNPELGPLTQIYITKAYHSSILWLRYYRNLARAKATSDDQAAFQACCPMISNSQIDTEISYCHLYARKRPVPSCSSHGYDPPIIGWSGGDPHMKTLDGFTYTFNGIGDYNLLSLKNSSDFVIHCRMDKAVVKKNITDTIPKATVFSAFALSAFQGALVELYMNVSTGNVSLLVNKELYNVTFFNNTKTINGTDVTWKSGNKTQLSVTYESGAGAVINVFKTLLTIQISSLPSFFNKTMGLLGVYNRDASDDLTNRNGTIIPINSTQKTIYYSFGKHWQLGINESLFTLDNADYDPTYTPLFYDNIEDLFGNNTALKEEAILICGRKSFTCLFDVMITGDKKAAAESKSTLEEANEEQTILATYPPNILSPKAIVLTHGIVYNSQIVAASQASSNLTFTLEVNGINATIDSKTGNFSLAVNSTDFTIKFLVQDQNGLSAMLLPNIRLCYCLNGSSCNASAANTLASSPNFYLTYGKCICRPGQIGAFCQNIDFCRYSHCFPGVNCTNNNVNKSADCGLCPNGYAGDGRNCEDINECANATSHNCHANARCQNRPGTFKCACNNGYTGNGTFCQDIDECAYNIHHCDNMATCINKVGTYGCTCNKNYTGNGTYCKDVDECALNSTNNCNVNADCTNAVGSYSCSCKAGFTGNGIICTDIDECKTKTYKCSVHGACINTIGSYKCVCMNGYFGNGRQCDVGNNRIVCGDTSMVIYLDNRTVVTNDTKLTLRDANCILKRNIPTSELGIAFSYHECGTTITETATEIQYNNEVRWVSNPLPGGITRSNVKQITFSCSLSRHANTSDHQSLVPTTVVNATEIGYGSFTVTLSMMTSSDYSSKVTSFPATIALDARVYFEVQLLSSHPHIIVLLIEKCSASPTMYKDHSSSYFLIKDRCGVDSTTKFHSSNDPHKKRFSFQSFKFVGSSDAVYIHCQVFMCHRASTDNRCTSGCQSNNINRSRRSVLDGFTFMDDNINTFNGLESIENTKVKHRRAIPKEYLPSKEYSLSIGPFKKAEVPYVVSGTSNNFISMHGMAIGLAALGLIVIGMMVKFFYKRNCRRSANVSEKVDSVKPKHNEGFELQ